MTISELIESLQKHPGYLPVMCVDEMGNCGEADGLKFEGNHVRIVLDSVDLSPLPDEVEDTTY